MDCFPFVRKENSGQREQYYVENSHPGIVSREDFARVQELFKRRAENKTRSYRPHLFSRKIICGKCGSIFTRRSTASGYTCWVCRNHDKKSSFCEMGRIKERCLYEAFQRMYQKLKCHEKEILEPAQKQLHDLDEALKQADPMQKKLYQEIAELMEKNYKLSKLYTSDLLDADAYIARSNEISAKLSKLQEQRKQNQRSQIIWEKMESLRKVAELIQDGPEMIEEIEEQFFNSLVEKIVAETPQCIRFCLPGGIELTEQLGGIGR